MRSLVFLLIGLLALCALMSSERSMWPDEQNVLIDVGMVHPAQMQVCAPIPPAVPTPPLVKPQGLQGSNNTRPVAA